MGDSFRPGALLATALVVLAGGAATLALADAPAPTRAVGGGVSMPWELRDCTFFVVQATVDRDAIQARLPAGFRAASFWEPWPAPGTPEAGIVGIEANLCESGSGLAGAVAPMTYASFWTPVVPPEDLVIPGYEGAYYVNFDVLVPDADRRAAFVAAGLPARDGDVAIAAFGPATPATTGVVSARYALAGLGEFEIDAQGAPAPAGGFWGSFAQWTEAEDGDLAFWEVDYAATTLHRGWGEVRVPADSWLATLFGGEVVTGLTYTGTWDYTDGTIELPE